MPRRGLPPDTGLLYIIIELCLLAGDAVCGKLDDRLDCFLTFAGLCQLKMFECKITLNMKYHLLSNEKVMDDPFIIPYIKNPLILTKSRSENTSISKNKDI